MWTASLHNGRALMGGKAKVELLEGLEGRCCSVVVAMVVVRGGKGREAKGFTSLLGRDQFMGIQSRSRYSLNASSGGMEQHQLECVSR